MSVHRQSSYFRRLTSRLSFGGVTRPYEESLSSFSFAIFSASIGKGEANVIMSPWCMHSLLAISMVATYGDTKKEVTTAMYLSDELEADAEKTHTELCKMYQKLYIRAFTSGETYLVSQVFVDSEVRQKKAFAGDIKALYNAKIAMVDFQSSVSQAVKKINAWANETNDGRFGKVVDESKISVSTKALIVSGFMYEGIWRSGFGFNPKSKSKGQFKCLTGRVVPVEMIAQLNKFPRGKLSYIDDVDVIRLPYEKDIDFVIFLPMSNVAFERFEEFICGSSYNIRIILQEAYNFKPQKTLVKLPKIRLSCSMSYKDILMHDPFRMKNFFDPNTSNYSNMTSTKPFCASLFEHKAVFSIGSDSVDTKFPVMELPTQIGNDNDRFSVTSPFYFFITCAELIPLIMGRITSATEEDELE